MIEVTVNPLEYFEWLLKRQLRLSKFILRRRGRDNPDYTVITPEGDRFWLYCYNFPNVVVMPVIGDRGRCSCCTTHESTLRSYVQQCISSMRNDKIL
jgi:hypothetical protein